MHHRTHSIRRTIPTLTLPLLALLACSNRTQSSRAEAGTNANTGVAPGATATPGTTGAPPAAPPPAMPLVVGVRLDQLSQYGAMLLNTFGAGHPQISQGLSQLEQMAHLPPGSVQNGTWPAAFGIDASRPVVIEVLPAEPGVLAAVDQVAANRGNNAVLGPMIQNWSSGAYAAHCVLPALNAQQLETTLTGFLAGGAQPGAAIAGYDSVMQVPASSGQPAIVAGFGHDASSVTIDIVVASPNASIPMNGAAAVLPPGPMDRARNALGTLRTRFAALLTAPQNLPAGVISARWNYVALADYNIALGLERVRDAVASLSATDPHRGDLVGQGVTEALTSRALIQRDGVPFSWGSLAVETTGALRVTLTAHGADAMPPMPATRGSAMLNDPASALVGDASTAWMQAWNLPGDAPGHRVTSQEFRRQISAAGMLGAFLASAHVPAALMRAAAEQDPMQGLFAAHMASFERIGVDVLSVDPDRTAGVAILQPSATPETAACVLANSPSDCPAVMLRESAATNVPGGAAQLVNSGGRRAVLATTTPQALARPSLSIVVTPFAVPTARVQIDVTRTLPPARAQQVPPEYRVWNATLDASGHDETIVFSQGPLR